MANLAGVLPDRDIGAYAKLRRDGIMIADDFKAINAAMKANEATKAALDAYNEASKNPGIGPMIAPCAAACAFSESIALAYSECVLPVAIADGLKQIFSDGPVPDLYEYPSREFLGDPEC